MRPVLLINCRVPLRPELPVRDTYVNPAQVLTIEEADDGVLLTLRLGSQVHTRLPLWEVLQLFEDNHGGTTHLHSAT